MQDMKMQNKKCGCTFRKRVTGNTRIRCRIANRAESMGKVRIAANFSRNFSLLSFSNYIHATIFSHATFPDTSWYANSSSCFYHTSLARSMRRWLTVFCPTHRSTRSCRRCWRSRPGLDVANMANYHPVSNLTFVSKVIEQAVASQLYEYLVANNLLPRYQSAYRTEAFNRNRHATCLVEHTDSRPQTPAHSAWHSWPVGGVRLCWPGHSTAATSDRSWHVGCFAVVDSGILGH